MVSASFETGLAFFDKGSHPLFLVFGGETDGKGVTLHLTGGRQIDVASGIDDFFGQPQGNRITSYNVCYTKLLRSVR